jgi:hypothetical protein
MGNGGPGMLNGGEESCMKGPRRFVAEKGSPRDTGGNGSEQGHVIRGVASNRGKGRGGEAQVPGMVDENSVKTNEGRDISAVGPGKQSVAQGKLNKGQVINTIVEQASIRHREVSIVAIAWVTSKVKVAGNDPRDKITRLVGSKVLKEKDFFGPITRGINVHEAKSGTINIEG